MTKLKPYQEVTIESLKTKVQKLLNSRDKGVVIFQAPTGAGKTLMVSEVLKRLVTDLAIRDSRSLSFIWISVRMLHEQSKEDLKRYYENDNLIKCSFFEDLNNRMIDENEILFLNWHSINKKDNIYIRENERDNNLRSIVENTKEQGRQIILVVDESHHTARTEKSTKIIEIIDPKVRIDISATPDLSKKNFDEIEKVSLEDVKADGMVKTEIVINPKFADLKVDKETSDEVVIGQALKKREELAELYKKEKVDVNPLVLIQLPDEREGLFSKKDTVIDILKNKFNITEENNKLAIWLSGEKTPNLESIDQNNNEVQVLLFKQAIALGWDCPRAQILVIFRESKSFTFTIQTIGRITRMPEQKHYANEELNKGYIFTDLDHIKIAEDYAKDYLTTYESRRDNSIYKPLELVSVYLKKGDQRKKIKRDFIKIFFEVMESFVSQIVLQAEKITLKAMSDGKVVDFGREGEVKSKGQLEIEISSVELQREFDKFVIENYSSHALGVVKQAIYDFFNLKFGLEKYDSKIQRIVLRQKDIFSEAIRKAKEIYEKKQEFREKEIIENWEIPLADTYKTDEKVKAREDLGKKSIMKPFYINKLSEPEEIFLSKLEESPKVQWWYKNRESNKKYFAISYFKNGKEWAFYVDFIVMFEDGRIGLFDTKSGLTERDPETKLKAEALQRYIQEQNQQNQKRLVGGIVKLTKNQILLFNDQEVYNPDSDSDWRNFVLEFL